MESDRQASDEEKAAAHCHPEKAGQVSSEAPRAAPDDTHVITYRGAAVADVKGSFHRAVVASGIPTDGYDRVMPHTLRHTCATWLMQKGVDKNEACAFLGMTIRTLERHYEHHHPDYQKGARDAF